MRYSAKIDLWIKLLFYFSIATIIFPVFTIPSEEMIFYLLAVLPITVFILWMLFGSFYEFKDEYLHLRIGPISRKITYDNIKSISNKRNWSSSMAMTNDRVFIELHHKTMFKSDVQVGPLDKEEFTDELRRRCKKLVG